MQVTLRAIRRNVETLQMVTDHRTLAMTLGAIGVRVACMVHVNRAVVSVALSAVGRPVIRFHMGIIGGFASVTGKAVWILPPGMPIRKMTSSGIIGFRVHGVRFGISIRMKRVVSSTTTGRDVARYEQEHAEQQWKAEIGMSGRMSHGSTSR